MPYCQECGESLDKIAKFCQNCGTEASKKIFKNKSDKEEIDENENISQDNEEIFECEYCSKKLYTKKALLRHEKKCEENEDENKDEKVIIKEYHHKSSGVGSFLVKLILFFIVIGIIIFVIIAMIGSSGVGEIASCKIRYSECNYACGEGWGSGACKTKCSYEYNQCGGN